MNTTTAKRKSGKLVRSIVTQIVITSVIASIFMLLTPMRFAAIVVAIVIWTSILCWTPAFNMWFIKPRANTAVVLASALNREKALVTEEELTSLQPSRTMRVVFGPTLAGKAPWEEIVGGKIVNLVRSITIGGPLDVITSDNIGCQLQWQAFLSVIPSNECIINLVRHNEEKIVDTFTDSCEAFIQSQVRMMTADQLFQEISYDPNASSAAINPRGTLASGFSNLFYGDKRIHPTEQEMGMRTSNLLIFKVVVNEVVLKALQSKAIAEKATSGIKVYTDADVSPDVAANLNALDRGLPLPSDITKHIVQGLGAGARFIIGDFGNERKK